MFMVTIWWFVSAHKWFKGPKVNIEHMMLGRGEVVEGKDRKDGDASSGEAPGSDKAPQVTLATSVGNEVHTFLRPPCAPVFTRLRLLITSVLREMGRGRLCSFRNRPQALHRTEPDSSRRQSGVVLVWQF